MSVVVVNHMTLDGVMQAPAAADEDTRGRFTHGGWSVPYGNHVMGEFMGTRMAGGDGAMLFGRWTYESFRCAWTDLTDDNPFTDVLNKTQKYVVSTTLEEPLRWMNSTLLAGDAADAVAELKAQSDDNLTILGSHARAGAPSLKSGRRARAHDPPTGPRIGAPPVRGPRLVGRGVRPDRLRTHDDRHAHRHLQAAVVNQRAVRLAQPAPRPRCSARPVPQRALTDSETVGNVDDLAILVDHQRHRVTLELIGERAPRSHRRRVQPVGATDPA